LIANKGYFAEFIAEYLIETQDDDIANEDMEMMEEIAEKVKPMLERALSKSDYSVSESGSESIRKISSQRSLSVISGLDKDKSSVKSETKKDGRKGHERTGGKLIEAETSETGSVKLGVYKNYIQTIGICICSCILFSFIGSNVSQVFSSLWLSQWSNDALDPNKTGDTKLRDLRLGVYGGFGTLEAIFTLAASISLNLACIRAAKILHNNMLKRIIRAPMSFFGIVHNYLQIND
jgi:hypothetical protein